MPASKILGHQDYDDRIHRLLQAAFTGFNADIRPMLEQAASTPADHESNDRLSHTALHELTRINEAYAVTPPRPNRGGRRRAEQRQALQGCPRTAIAALSRHPGYRNLRRQMRPQQPVPRRPSILIEFRIHARCTEGSLRGLKKLFIVQNQICTVDKRHAAQGPVEETPHVKNVAKKRYVFATVGPLSARKFLSNWCARRDSD
jgi:hypothetical protein